MSPASSSSPRIGDAPDKYGTPVLITGTVSGSAHEIWIPTARDTADEYVFVTAGTIHTETVKLSVGLGGTSLGYVFEQDILPKSGLNTVLSWEWMRAPMGSVWIWASVASVITIRAYSKVTARLG